MNKTSLFFLLIMLIAISCGLFKKKQSLEQPHPIPQAEIGKPLPPNDAIMTVKIIDIKPTPQENTYRLTVLVEQIQQRGHGFKFDVAPKKKLDIISFKPLELKPNQTVKIQITGSEEMGNKTTFTLVKTF